MPELPEVETVMRALAARLTGRRFVRVEQRRADLRFPLPDGLPGRLEGRTLRHFGRRAKYIQAHLDDGRSLLLHLGMSGRLLLDGESRGPHEHLTFTFDDGSVLRFVDPRRFGMLDLAATDTVDGHRWLAHLGHEPLGNAFSGPALLAGLEGRRTPVKVALMDQRLVVGVGNIYASESLHRAGIAPWRLALSIGPEAADRLVAAIRDVLTDAIDAGGSSLRDYVQSNGELGNFQNAFRVYDRAGRPCGGCGRPIERIVQTGRATYFCGHCQR
ncbi:MAG TPA: bifunctional DNA-formamidopyrimidine glycosylase/DNA-(apurinic or apyrimidinic site) lyase [Geminicoccaceae bacterium]|nr:bifunctional DNA-formamidopyrimidine glycosylase/DNA-(apurinic or apyrimidinic site) lyase [Geminicoccus sp.]HMU52688.1 bifunctional DNA-formamidopyrimidine glycosylase/DNA-(apurinic or apyrimidinic site) lyase [Geminicoccaceae bacterium]